MMNIAVQIVQLRCACLYARPFNQVSVLFISTGCGTDAG